MISWLPRSRGHITIREICESDLSLLYELESDEYLKKFIVGGPVKTQKDEWIGKARTVFCGPGEIITFAIEDKVTGSFAGRASLGHFLRNNNPAHREVEVVLAKSYLGRGFGVEATSLLCSMAFEFLGAESVFGVIHPDHPRSFQLVVDLGFSEDSPQRDSSGAVVAKVFKLSRDVYIGLSSRAAQ